jgi:hypothetical protein
VRPSLQELLDQAMNEVGLVARRVLPAPLARRASILDRLDRRPAARPAGKRRGRNGRAAAKR